MMDGGGGSEIHVLHLGDTPDGPGDGDVPAILEHIDDRISVTGCPDWTVIPDRLDRYDCIVCDLEFIAREGVEQMESLSGRTDRPPMFVISNCPDTNGDTNLITASVVDIFPGHDPDSYQRLGTSILQSVTDESRSERSVERLEDPQAVIERISDVVIALDSDWQIMYVNRAGAALFDRDVGEILDHRLWDLDSVAEGSPLYRSYRAAMETQEPQTIEEYHEPSDRWFRGFLYPGPNGLTVLLRDVTEHRQQEQAFRDAHGKLEAVIHAGDIGTWEWIPETDRVYLSDWIIERMGITDAMEREWLTVDELSAYVHPDERDRLCTAFAEADRNDTLIDVEFRIDRDDVPRWFVANGAYQARHAEPDRVAGIILDVTDRKDREFELEKLRERIQLALKGANSWLWEVDLETWETTQIAVSGLLGVDADEIVRPLDSFYGSVHPDDRDRIRKSFRSAAENQGSYHEEYRLIENGEMRWIEARGRFFEDPDAGPGRMIGIAMDITDRKENERELERQNERLEEFASMVSHDIRNPLEVAKGRIELATAEVENTHLDDAARALDRIEAVIEDVMLYAREGQSVTATEWIDLQEFVRRCWQLVDTGAVTLEIETDVKLKADPGRLQRMLENLLRNTVDHGGDRIRIGSTPEGNGIFIEDNGPGIAEEVRAAVFERGFSTYRDGTGFGLAIVKQIVEAHGWSITITEGPDGGARFEITDIDLRSE